MTKRKTKLIHTQDYFADKKEKNKKRKVKDYGKFSRKFCKNGYQQQ